MLDADASIADRWESFKSAVKDSVEKTIFRRRGPSHERWISDETRRLIEKRKNVKIERDQMCYADERREKGKIYDDLNKTVRKRC